MIAEFFFLLQIVAPVFIVMALGYATRKIDILSSEGSLAHSAWLTPTS